MSRLRSKADPSRRERKKSSSSTLRADDTERKESPARAFAENSRMSPKSVVFVRKRERARELFLTIAHTGYCLPVSLKGEMVQAKRNEAIVPA